nr:MAG TPA: hypothetical protein [Caudoviricetes sp.]
MNAMTNTRQSTEKTMLKILKIILDKICSIWYNQYIVKE